MDEDDYYGSWANQIIIGYFYITLKRSDFLEVDEIVNNE